MKGFFVGLLVLGGIVLVAGGACIAVGYVNHKQNETEVINTHDFEDDITKLDLGVRTANIEIVKTDEAKTTVICEEKEKVYHEVTVKDGLLKIRQVDERKWYERYIFNFNFKQMKVTVFLPKDTYEGLTLDSATGSINVKEGFAFGDVKSSTSTGSFSMEGCTANDVTLKSSTGSNYIERVNANKISMKSSTGSLNIKKCQAVDAVELEASTGSVRIDELTAKSFKSKTSTGGVHIKNLTVTDDIVTNSSTGNIDLENVTAASYEAKASSGHVELTNTIISGNIKIKTSTGHVRFTDSDAESLNVETDTGSVKGNLLTPKIVYFESDTGHGKYPKVTAGGRFDIKTDTGDADITFPEQ